MADFTLRPMEPTDGPAIDALMRHEAQTTSVGMTTHYRHDVYDAFLAQHPTLFGVVAEEPGSDGLVGMATAFIDEVTVGGRVFPTAHLENLKVRHDARRQGLGARLAAWRIEEADRRFGGEGIVTAGIEATNTASLATARRWSTQLLGPVRLVIGSTRSKPPPDAAWRSGRSPMTTSTPCSTDSTRSTPATTSCRGRPGLVHRALAVTGLGEPIRAYRIAVAGDGSPIAGAEITERFKLMTDHLDSVPLPIAILGRITGLIPADRIIRSVEIGLAWHVPGRVDAARAVWEAIRFEWRDRATTVVGLADPRGSLIEAFHVGRTPAPRVELMAPVRSPVPLDPDRLCYLWR